MLAAAVSMLPRRTYVDTSVLLAAFKGEGELALRALALLDQPDNILVVSDAVRLESMPKARFYGNDVEVQFYEEVFSKAEHVAWDAGALRHALVIAEQHGIAAMDAIHVAHAAMAGVTELVTAEKPTKPMFRVKSIVVRSIRVS